MQKRKDGRTEAKGENTEIETMRLKKGGKESGMQRSKKWSNEREIEGVKWRM